MKIEVYSDGSGMTKKTPGGYGYVVVIDGAKKYEGYGHMPLATNNDAELQAAIEGLNSLNSYFSLIVKPDISMIVDIVEVILVSDSQIILKWASGQNEFKQEDKRHKYDELIELMKKFNVKTHWVPGHSGNVFNERCDKLANAARLNLSIEGH